MAINSMLTSPLSKITFLLLKHTETSLKVDNYGVELGHDKYTAEFLPKVQTTADEIYDCLKQGEVHGTGQFTIIGQGFKPDIPRLESDSYKYGNLDYIQGSTMLPESASCNDESLEVCKQGEKL